MSIDTQKEPSEDANERMFVALVKNAFGYITKSVKEIEDEPSHSVVHFALGIELLFKSRLLLEHWTLVCANPHKANWGKLKTGEEDTIGGRALIRAMMATHNLIDKKQNEAFEEMNKHRNRAVHFFPKEDVNELTLQLFTAFENLERFTNAGWLPDTFLSEVKSIRKALSEKRLYVYNKRWNELRETQDYKEQLERGTLRKCEFCDFKPDIVFVTPIDDHLSGSRCGVCYHEGFVGFFECKQEIDWKDISAPCGCEGSHDSEKIRESLREATEFHARRPEEELCGPVGRPWCSACEDQEIAIVGTIAVCLSCNNWDLSANMYSCERCNASVISGDPEDVWGCVACYQTKY